MRTIIRVICCLTISVFVVSCDGRQLLPTPATTLNFVPMVSPTIPPTFPPASVKIVNHEEPNIQVDFSPFKNVGCTSDGNNSYSCEEGSLLHDLGCDTIYNDHLLGGLNPNYPIARCASENIYLSTCINKPIQYCVRYVIYKYDEYHIVGTMDDFRRIFAPVDSPEEALSFVEASPDYFVSYGQTKQSYYIYNVKVLEDTFVETLADGYLVHVFDYDGLGCGPKYTYSVEAKVTYDGNIKEVSRNPVYRDPSLDDECIQEYFLP
jgi:hypothetical protein